MVFIDRRDAGRHLAAALTALSERRPFDSPVVMGLPRGGVPVAAEVAAALGAPLDVLIVHKVRSAQEPSFALGAVGEDGVRVMNDRYLGIVNVPETELDPLEARERALLERRAAFYRESQPAIPLAGCTAIVVDDGINSGATAQVACRVARLHGAAAVVLAVPVAPASWENRMGSGADDYVCVVSPDDFTTVADCYEDFAPITDEEVIVHLRAARVPR